MIDSVIINIPDPEGLIKSLFLAIQKGDIKLVQSLIKSEVNINSCGSNQFTPLHAAAKSICPGAIEIIDELIAAGAKIDARDAQDNTPLHYAAQSCNQEMDPNHVAIQIT